MGRATRWLKGLFGIKKQENSSSGDRKRCSLGQSGRDTTGLCHNPATIPPNLSPAEASWIKSFYTESENKHAIAVAAATAAAADAAVAAAQAAVAVVRLTSQGRGTMFGGGGREMLAAIKIQSLFRGYLSRRALKALRGLVKLQALVRGYLVRKQATATLYSMQALIRAQASVRAQKSGYRKHEDERFRSQFRPRKSIERFDETRSEYTTSIHSRRLSSSFETPISTIDESPKIVEVDPGRPKSRSRRTNTWTSDSGDYPYGQTLSSPLPHQTPSRLSVLNCRNCLDSEWGSLGEECRFSTAQSTPRFANSCGSNGPVPYAKSVCVDSFFYGQNGNYHPNYMSNTKSFKAKLRSHSAPKQRPELGPKKRLSLNEMMESRNSISGIRMQRSCSQAQEVVSFKNAVMGKLGRSSEFVREPERQY